MQNFIFIFELSARIFKRAAGFSIARNSPAGYALCRLPSQQARKCLHAHLTTNATGGEKQFASGRSNFV